MLRSSSVVIAASLPEQPVATDIGTSPLLHSSNNTWCNRCMVSDGNLANILARDMATATHPTCWADSDVSVDGTDGGACTIGCVVVLSVWGSTVGVPEDGATEHGGGTHV